MKNGGKTRNEYQNRVYPILSDLKNNNNLTWNKKVPIRVITKVRNLRRDGGFPSSVRSPSLGCRLEAETGSGRACGRERGRRRDRRRRPLGTSHLNHLLFVPHSTEELIIHFSWPSSRLSVFVGSLCMSQFGLLPLQ